MLTWNLMIVESRHRSPLILVGDGWQSVFAQVFEKLGKYTPESQRNLLQFAADVETAVKMLESFSTVHAEYTSKFSTRIARIGEFRE
jgi:hypothetical protein